MFKGAFSEGFSAFLEVLMRFLAVFARELLISGICAIVGSKYPWFSGWVLGGFERRGGEIRQGWGMTITESFI